MKVEKIVVSYSADKLQAIRVLKPEVYGTIEKLLEDCLDKLYVKSIPLTTRQYIEARMRDEEQPAKTDRKT